MALLPVFPLPSAHHPHAAPQRGTGMIEFLLIAIPLLLTTLGGIEISHWMFTRQAVNMALTEAGRAGSTLHANPQAIIQAFEQALEPLYPPTGSATSAQRLQAAIARNQSHHQQLPWHIQVMSPTPEHFRDFSSTDPAVRHPSGLPTLNNSYQLEQHQAHKQQGLPDGKGHHSGQTIFEANTLALRLTWRYTPLLPGFEQIANGRLAMKQDITLTMQSHPVLWPDDAAGRVTRSADPAGAEPAGGTTLPPSGSSTPHPAPNATDLAQWPERPPGSTSGQSGTANPTDPNNAHPPSASAADQYAGITGETASNNGEAGGAASADQGGQTGQGTGEMPNGQAGTGPKNEPQGFTGDDPGAAEGSMCMNISPPFTIPSSERARSSMASLPDLRS